MAGWRSWCLCGPWLAGRCFGLSRSAARRAAASAGPRRSLKPLPFFALLFCSCCSLLPTAAAILLGAACTSLQLLQITHPAPTGLRPRGGVNNTQTQVHITGSQSLDAPLSLLLGLELAAVYTFTAGKSALKLDRSNREAGWSPTGSTAHGPCSEAPTPPAPPSATSHACHQAAVWLAGCPLLQQCGQL